MDLQFSCPQLKRCVNPSNNPGVHDHGWLKAWPDGEIVVDPVVDRVSYRSLEINMVFRTKVTLRGEQWRLSEDAYGITWIETGWQNDKRLLKLSDLSLQESALVKEARRLAIAKSKELSEQTNARFAAEDKEILEGAVRIRGTVWNVESDHIWRYGEKDRIIMKFSELTNDEISNVMWAKEREIENRGIGGFFKRLGRKMDKF